MLIKTNKKHSEIKPLKNGEKISMKSYVKEQSMDSASKFSSSPCPKYFTASCIAKSVRLIHKQNLILSISRQSVTFCNMKFIKNRY